MTIRTCKRVPHKFIGNLSFRKDKRHAMIAAALATIGYTVKPNQPFNLIVKGS